MSFELHHPLQAYWDLAVASVQGAALAGAVSAGLFQRLRQPGNAAEVAAALQWKPLATAHVLELLWSMRLLERSEHRELTEETRRYTYRNAPLAQRYFETGSAQYCGDAWLYRLRSLRHFGASLPQHLANGDAPAPAPAVEHFHSAKPVDWAGAARGQIGQEQRAVTVAAALDIVTPLPEFAGMQHGLDLGGGPGWVAIALAQANAQARFTVFDWPETVAVAQENIEREGLAARMKTLAGDLAKDDIGSGYDMIWCSLVLYFVPDPQAALKKMFDALAPGGVLVCVHAEIDDDADTAAKVAPYYFPMRVLGRHVPRCGELEPQLRAAGFTAIERSACHHFPLAPVQVLVARRAA